MNTKPLLIAGTLTAVLLAGYALMPKTGDRIAPDTEIAATGEATAPIETTTAPVEATQDTAAMVVNQDGEAIAGRSPIASYSTQEDCQSATGRECHEIRCEGMTEGQTAEDVCGPEFVEGWQAVVPTPDNTAIPEIIAPPMETAPEPTTTP
jgi:hypothetical protein